MTCPSCNSPLEPNARFCGVCGYRLAPNQRPGNSSSPRPGDRARGNSATPGPLPGAASGGTPPPQIHAPGERARSPSHASQPKAVPGGAASPNPNRLAAPVMRAAGSEPARLLQPAVAPSGPNASTQPIKPPSRITPKRPKTSDDVYLGQVLNNRFKVESKIGEGGFGAVYRGVQLATGRKVALKLLHPDMTKDENLVARFRREGMVLCNLRDAHTITTYDFDQTPSGTLYIAMELLEGKSLHQVFHDEAPLDWKRVFKILTEMCSSLAEAHQQGIVHRDLKPENIYLEARPGNPEFVKILDFGIAKVMRGETIDPQSPQLTATGQTLGTLEYMSPEQLMGKALDGRSDVYALGVLAYEMITGRLPFPDAKGPAGLITAQLKQTPMPPSQACPQALLPRSADRAILKCLEKDKNNRFPDVSALSAALQEAISGLSSEPGMAKPRTQTADMLETRRGDASNLLPPPMPAMPPMQPMTHLPGMQAMPPVAMGSPVPAPRGAAGPTPTPPLGGPPLGGLPPTPTPPPGGVPGERSSALAAMGMAGAPGSGLSAAPMMTPPIGSPVGSPVYPPTPANYPLAPGSPIAPRGAPLGAYPQRLPPAPLARASSRLVWWVIALLAIGAAGGTLAGLLLSK